MKGSKMGSGKKSDLSPGGRTVGKKGVVGVVQGKVNSSTKGKGVSRKGL